MLDEATKSGTTVSDKERETLTIIGKSLDKHLASRITGGGLEEEEKEEKKEEKKK
jgi:hypothetical protein